MLFEKLRAVMFSCSLNYGVPTGQGKVEKVREFVWSRRNNFFGKVRESDVGSCRLQISVIFCISKYEKADKFAAFIDV